MGIFEFVESIGRGIDNCVNSAIDVVGAVENVAIDAVTEFVPGGETIVEAYEGATKAVENVAVGVIDSVSDAVIDGPVADKAMVVAVAAGAAVAGVALAPTIAATLGKAGLLGAASTATEISTLSGAALQSASLAKLGGGAIASGGFGMAGGTAVVGTSAAVTAGTTTTVVQKASS